MFTSVLLQSPQSHGWVDGNVGHCVVVTVGHAVDVTFGQTEHAVTGGHSGQDVVETKSFII